MRLLIVLFLIPVLTFGQAANSNEISYKLGPDYKEIGGEGKYYFIGKDQIIRFTVDWGYGTYKYTTQSIDPKTLKVKDLEEYKNSKDHVFEGIELINDRLFLFYTRYKNRTEEEQLFVDEIDMNTGKLKGEEKCILKVEGNTYGIKDKFDNITVNRLARPKQSFTIKQSLDSSKLMVSYWYPISYKTLVPELGVQKSYHVRMGFHVFDAEISPIWDKVVEMPYPDRRMDYFDFILDSTGDVYFLANIFKNNVRKVYKNDGSLNRHVELLRVEATTQKLTHTKIDLEEHEVYGAKLQEGIQGKIVCAGFYNDGREQGSILGSFIGEVDKNNTSISINKYSNSQYLRPDRRTSYVELVNLVPFPDGSFLLLGEEHESTKHENYTFYKYGTVLMTKFSAKNTVSWMQSIHKKQTSKKGLRDMGFRYVSNYNNHHYLILIDNKKNLNLSADMDPAGHWSLNGGYVFMCKISDKSGTMNQKIVLNTSEVPEIKNKGIFFSTHSFLQLNPNAFFHICSSHMGSHLLKFKIN